MAIIEVKVIQSANQLNQIKIHQYFSISIKISAPRLDDRLGFAQRFEPMRSWNTSLLAFQHQPGSRVEGDPEAGARNSMEMALVDSGKPRRNRTDESFYCRFHDDRGVQAEVLFNLRARGSFQRLKRLE
ncbi:hypothetical protein KEC55_30780 [Burkholderia cepacia]|uniref:hypothetical protein n=1 Tax=Burkholderia cepacia TaxID=292 RepID=UPI00249DC86D|nr:hypothetical protein [Burkholderia cepacia]WGY71373.1 hypothetical protein KEC55_30780 [Burkholderia cepacia]